MDQAPASIYLRQIKRIAHGNLSKSSLNTKSFYHGLKSFSCGLENQSRVFSLWYSKNSLSHFKKDYISLFERKTISFWFWFSYIIQKKIYSLLNIKIEKINGHLYFTTKVVFLTAENKSVLWLLKIAFWRTSRDSPQCLHGKPQLISQFRQSLKLSSLFWLMIFCDSQQHKLNKQNTVHLTTLRASYSYK